MYTHIYIDTHIYIYIYTERCVSPFLFSDGRRHPRLAVGRQR